MPRYIIGDNVVPTVGTNYTDKATVLAVQKALTAKGFAPKKGNDGVWGPDTKETLQSWQYETGQAVTGVIDYGVLLALGVPAPGTAATAASASAASTLADATRRAHAAVPSDVDEVQKQAAQQAVAAAKTRVATAATPQAQQVAKQQLAVAEQHLEAVAPSSFLTRPVLGQPLWLLLVGGVGVLAVGVGAYAMLTGTTSRSRSRWA